MKNGKRAVPFPFFMKMKNEYKYFNVKIVFNCLNFVFDIEVKTTSTDKTLNFVF